MNIIILTELASQQIAILGYIQYDGRMLYVKEKHQVDPRDIIKPPVPPVENFTTMSAWSNTRTLFYILTTDQEQALRI